MKKTENKSMETTVTAYFTNETNDGDTMFVLKNFCLFYWDKNIYNII